MGRVNGRPKLLFLCQTLPYPPDGGVWIRTYHILRLLSQAFDITALCFERAQSSTLPPAANGDGPTALRAYADVATFAIPQKHNPLRFAWDHLRSTVRRRVYTEYLYDSREFRDRVTGLLRAERFDLVHMDSLVDLAGYLDAVHPLHVVCVHHAVESALLRRRATVEASAWRRAYLRYQAGLMEQLERRRCEDVALNVAVSAADGLELSRLAPAARVTVVPNGVDIHEFRPADDPGEGVAFIGGLNWFPNRDALEFYGESILPVVTASGGHGPTRWIGQASADEQQRYREQFGIELTGYAADVRPLMQAARCHVVPLRAGGGTRLKILNSWAMGKAVVSTTLGCEGLDAQDGENILVRDDPRAFGEAVAQVLRDDRLRQRLERGGRATAESRYSWDRIGAPMISTYRELAGASR